MESAARLPNESVRRKETRGRTPRSRGPAGRPAPHTMADRADIDTGQGGAYIQVPSEPSF